MFEFIFKIWFLIGILPFIIFTEGNKMLVEFLKKRDIYSDWDSWHSLLVIFVVLFIILWMNGYRF